MGLVYLGQLGKVEATERFEAWATAMPAAAERFLGSLPPAIASAAASGVAGHEAVMRWTKSQERLVAESPEGVPLPLWLRPGPPTPGYWEPSLEHAWLLDGFAAWNASSMLTGWPGSQLFLGRARRGKADGMHNAWLVGNGDSSSAIHVSVLTSVYALLSNVVHPGTDIIATHVRNQARKLTKHALDG